MNTKKIFLLLMISGSLFMISCMDQAGTRITGFESSKPASIQSNYESFQPVFHPKGDEVFFTDAKEEGLYMRDPGTAKITQISTEKLSGFNLFFDKEGDIIAFVTHDFLRKRRMNTLVVYDLNTSEQRILSEAKRYLKILDIEKNVLFFLENNELKAFDLSTGRYVDNNNVSAVTLNKNLELLVYQRGKPSTITPGGPGNYLWPSISPDGKHILYSISGKGSFICDLNGENIVALGRLHAPEWSPDGNWVIGMDDQDDGYRFTSSDVIVVSKDGKERNNLTERFEKIALYPSFSPDGKEVVFNDDSGILYKMKVR